jgi:hypothetical protein
MTNLNLDGVFLPTVQTACLFSAIKCNVATAKLAFLPGLITMVEDEIRYIHGDIIPYIQQGHPQTSQLNVQAFLNALADGTLSILYTPSQVLLDDVTEESTMLVLSDGTLGTAQVCWDTSTETATA